MVSERARVLVELELFARRGARYLRRVLPRRFGFVVVVFETEAHAEAPAQLAVCTSAGQVTLMRLASELMEQARRR
jgi:hypothetical protein